MDSTPHSTSHEFCRGVEFGGHFNGAGRQDSNLWHRFRAEASINDGDGRPQPSASACRTHPVAVGGSVPARLMHPGIIEQVPRMRMRRKGPAPPAPSSTCSSSSQVSVQLIVDRQRVWLIGMHHNDQRAPSCVSSGSCQGTRPRTQIVGRVPNTQEELPTDVVYRFCQAWPR